MVTLDSDSPMIRRDAVFNSYNSRTCLLAMAFVVFTFFNLPSEAQTNQPDAATRAEQARAECVKGRRYVCGRVVQITPDGLVVESGYSTLLHPPYHNSWVVAGNVSASKDPNAIEGKDPDSVCIGLVFLTDIPKRPVVKLYDYVVVHAYPAGQYRYVPVPEVQKNIRRFAAGLEHAIKINLASPAK